MGNVPGRPPTSNPSTCSPSSVKEDCNSCNYSECCGVAGKEHYTNHLSSRNYPIHVPNFPENIVLIPPLVFFDFWLFVALIKNNNFIDTSIVYIHRQISNKAGNHEQLQESRGAIYRTI